MFTLSEPAAAIPAIIVTIIQRRLHMADLSNAIIKEWLCNPFIKHIETCLHDHYPR